jgi:uncharacterized protein (TIGR00297 family)
VSAAPGSKTASPASKRTEAARKAVHVLSGLFALLLRFLNWWQSLLLALGALAFNGLILPRMSGGALDRDADRRRGYALGILLYPLSVATLIVIFHSRLDIAAAAWGLMAFGDGAATLAGTFLGGPRLPWNRSKSWAGFIAFVAAGSAAATILQVWVAGGHPGTPAPGFPVGALAIAVAIGGAFVESLPLGIDDNLTVPLLTGGALFALWPVASSALAAAEPPLRGQLLIAAGVNLLVAGAAYFARTVQPGGAVAGYLLGTAIYTFSGWRGYLILTLFFVLASGSTKVGYERKAARRIAQEAGGRRGARHAIANVGLAALLAFLAAGTTNRVAMLIAFTAALATAVFDTVSTEIGQVYGKHPILITTLRPVPPGTDGAVSLEGTAAGLLAGAALAAAAWATGMISLPGAAVAVAASFIGTTAESYIGATVESMKMVDNEAVNFANTLVGALSALAIWRIVH